MTESIRVDECDIEQEEFVDLVEEPTPTIERLNFTSAKDGPSLFEILFVIALLYFKRKNCEVIILEVGAGGRFDVTNVIEQPLVTAITTIDYDHTNLLGETLE